jgi:toxin ParE1/3/4
MQVVVADKAKSDLLRIYLFLEQHSPSAANDYTQRINSNFENVARFPFIGRERSNLAPGLRCLVVGVYLVFYIVEPEKITVVRVIDGRMDVDEEFHR